MRHPLEFVPQNLVRPLFYVFFILTISIFGIFNVLDVPLRTETAPNGIVSLELAGTPERAFQIMVSWEPINYQGPEIVVTRGHLIAAFGLGLDYLFMPVYAFALGFGTLMATAKHKGRIKQLGVIAGWGAFIAALFDAVENYMLFQVVLGDFSSPRPEIAALCATIKFFLLIFGLVVIGVARATRK
jgi:hypothetical protein